MSFPTSGPAGLGDDFRPTHVVPQEGLPAWEDPDVSRPTVALDAFLPVQLLSRSGDWGEVLCSNGWSAWVDGRLLVAVPQPPPTAGRPLARAEDPGPLLERAAEALERYRRAAGAGPDGEAFRRAVRGLRAGIVIDGEFVWVYDTTARRWMYAEGGPLATYAVAGEPGAPPAPQPPPGGADPGGGGDVEDLPHAPTRIVGLPDGGGR
ncbi:hypothetical protein OOK31_25015 [Streptomyces sp. NBC_00249]|uniref:hypothetical protein n=1 Tax=Streptomyces sp. NBC_00249 TaxID=2975690 RepID=UPI00225B3804|nr:hypothetical protein [Streptomyces sp. NBC_00249]MCX5197117.1 hypothetical protein [Streptomyces sp. NBC_00249]